MNFLNIELEKGFSHLFEMYYTDDVTGLPINLTGYSATLTVEPSNYGTGFTLSTLDNTIVLGTTNGKISAYFSPTVTQGIDWSQGSFSLALVDGLGVKAKLIKGLVTPLPSEGV